MAIEFNDYNIIKLERYRFKDLVYIFEAAYHSPVSEEELINRHLYCHGDIKFVGFIAYHKETNEPAAYYGVFPVYAVVNGKNELVAQSGDTMTHPSHQRKGLFVQLGKTTYDYCRTVGISLIFGCPNKNSHHGLTKNLGFTELAPLENISFLQNKFELYRFSSRSTWLSSLHLAYSKWIISLFSDKGERFQNSNARSTKPLVYVQHDEQYFKEKESNNKIFIRIKDVDIWLKVSQNHLSIGDINIEDPALASSIISRLKLITILSGYRFLSTGGTSNSYLISILKSLKHETAASYKPCFLRLSSAIQFDDFAILSSDIDVF